MCLDENEYYSTTSRDEYFSDRECWEFSNQEIAKIDENLHTSASLDRVRGGTAINICSRSKTNYWYFTVKKKCDEWYYVSSNICFYKCDQFDGLLKFIKDETFSCLSKR